MPWHGRQYSHNKRILILAVAISLAISLVIVSYIIWSQHNALGLEQKMYAKLDAEYRQTIFRELSFLPQAPAIDKVESLNKDIIHSKNRLTELQLLAQLMPESLWLSDLDYDGVKITLAGFSRTSASIVKFTELLDNSELFSNSQLQQQQEYGDSDGKQFKFTIVTQGITANF